MKNQKSENQALIKAFRQVIRLGLPMAGGALGGYFGGQPGFQTGTGIGSAAASLLGGGDYTVTSNSINLPTFKQDRSMRIKHREYIGDIQTSSTAGVFSSYSYLINPGNALLFPWLSGISQCFQQYKIHGMVFVFNSTSSDALNSTNTALGTLVMATNYDPNEEDYTSKQEMENSFFSNSTRPSASALHPIECAPGQTTGGPVKLISHGDEATSDYPAYHWGNFQLATVGFQGTDVNIGELWVTYDIELFKPKASDIPYYYYNGTSASAVYNNPVAGMTQLIDGRTNNLDLTFGTRTIIFPVLKKARWFQISFFHTKTAGAMTGTLWQPGMTAAGGDIQSGANYPGDTALNGPTYNITAALDNTTKIVQVFYIKMNPNLYSATDRTVSMSDGVISWSGAFVYTQLRVIEIPYALSHWST